MQDGIRLERSGSVRYGVLLKTTPRLPPADDLSDVKGWDCYGRTGVYNTDRRLMRRKELRNQSLLTGINALWCLLVLSPSAGLAESPVERLDPVLVTATTLPTNQSQTPLQTKVHSLEQTSTCSSPTGSAPSCNKLPGFSWMKWAAGAA